MQKLVHWRDAKGIKEASGKKTQKKDGNQDTLVEQMSQDSGKRGATVSSEKGVWYMGDERKGLTWPEGIGRIRLTPVGQEGGHIAAPPCFLGVPVRRKKRN